MVVVSISGSVMFSPLFKETARAKRAATKGGGCGVRGSSVPRTRRGSGLAPAPSVTAQVLRGPARPRAPPRSAPLPSAAGRPRRGSAPDPRTSGAKRPSSAGAQAADRGPRAEVRGGRRRGQQTKSPGWPDAGEALGCRRGAAAFPPTGSGILLTIAS